MIPTRVEALAKEITGDLRPYGERPSDADDSLPNMPSPESNDEAPSICSRHFGELATRSQSEIASSYLDIAESTEKLRSLVAPWIRQELSSLDLDETSEGLAVQWICYADKKDRGDLIRQALANDTLDSFYKDLAIEQICYASQQERSQLIEEVLANDEFNEITKKIAMSQIAYVSKKDQERLRAPIALQIHEILSSDAANRDKVPAIEKMQYLSEADQEKLQPTVTDWIYQTLADNQHQVYGEREAAEQRMWLKKKAIKQIRYASQEERAKIIDKVIDSKEFGVRAKEQAIEQICYTKREDAFQLISKILDNEKSFDLCGMRETVEQISHTSEEEVSKLISQVLDSSVISQDIKLSAISQIRYAKEEDRARLIDKVIEDDRLGKYTKTWAIEQMHCLKDPLEIDRLSEAYRQLRTISPVSDLTNSPLHESADRKELIEFVKTGPKTFILPAEHEASVRVLPLDSAITWLETAQNWPAWRQAGFNYVPVEPVLSATPLDNASEKGLPEVAITTTNLRGRSYEHALPSFMRFYPELNQMKETILDTLDDLRVHHGHAHDQNFVVVPFVKDDGQVDYSRCPRLYIIDFDQSKKT